jgi:hypothetical protein
LYLLPANNGNLEMNIFANWTIAQLHNRILKKPRLNHLSMLQEIQKALDPNPQAGQSTK